VQFDFYGHDALVHLALETDPDVAIVARVDGRSAARAGDASWLTVEGSAVVLAE
jgi:extradiol dioxygenase family protein